MQRRLCRRTSERERGEKGPKAELVVSFVVAGRSGGGGTRAGARAGQQLRPQRERARHRKGGHAARWPCSWPRAGGTLGAQAAADEVLWNLVAFPDLLLAFRDEGTLPLLLNASSCCRKVLHDGEARLHQARRKYGTVYIWSQSVPELIDSRARAAAVLNASGRQQLGHGPSCCHRCPSRWRPGRPCLAIAAAAAIARMPPQRPRSPAHASHLRPNQGRLHPSPRPRALAAPLPHPEETPERTVEQNLHRSLHTVPGRHNEVGGHLDSLKQVEQTMSGVPFSTGLGSRCTLACRGGDSSRASDGMAYSTILSHACRTTQYGQSRRREC